MKIDSSMPLSNTFSRQDIAPKDIETKLLEVQSLNTEPDLSIAYRLDLSMKTTESGGVRFNQENEPDIELTELKGKYIGASFKEMRRKFDIATKYAASNRSKFNTLVNEAKEEFSQKIGLLNELIDKFLENGDRDAFINSSLFDGFRKKNN